MLGEALKTYPNDFAGFQVGQLPTEQIMQRLCCARFCDGRGRVQIAVPGGYRIICGRHAVILLLNSLALLGDTSPSGEAKEYAEILDVPWAVVLATEPSYPTTPESFRCLRCGGGYLPETVGMLTGKRYIHTCGD